MNIRASVLAVGFGVMALGCAEQSDHTQEIIDNLVKAGFPTDDIMETGGIVYVGRDAEVSLAASREMLQPGEPSKEQYRTTNLISPTLAKICINGAAFTGVFSTALDLAIQNYDELPLSFAMARTPSTGCSFTINGVIEPGTVGGSAGFPSGGLPFPTINIGGGLSAFGVDTIEHVITHEIGHTIGFRHSDFFNRSISCGSGGNEGDGGIGAILIPGTPSGATVGGSIMNSCFRTAETGEFTATDRTALNVLYPPAGNVTNAVLACYVDTFAFDSYTNNFCSATWTPSTASDPTTASFEVFGLTAGSYSFTWTNLETGLNPGCGNTSFCTVGIATDVSGDGAARLSVLVRDTATGATKTVSARARYLDGWH